MFATRLFVTAFALALAACSGPAMDASTPLGKRALLDAVDNALSKEDCTTAVTLIKPAYESSNTDNQIRMAMAAAYACHSRIKLFTTVQSLAANSSRLADGNFWGMLSELFPSTIADRVPEAGNLAADALMAMTKAGWPMIPAYQFYTTTPNPGSLIFDDRVTDSNLFLVFTSMATIGGYNSRYGAPDTADNYKQTTRLPWRTVATMDLDGCSYAASVINMVDALEATADAATGSLKTTLTNISTAFSTGIKNACDIGCQNLDPDLALGDWQASGCAAPTNCADCPLLLRNRDTCFADAEAMCAAAGIVNFINDAPDSGGVPIAWPGP